LLSIIGFTLPCKWFTEKIDDHIRIENFQIGRLQRIFRESYGDFNELFKNWQSMGFKPPAADEPPGDRPKMANSDKQNGSRTHKNCYSTALRLNGAPRFCLSEMRDRCEEEIVVLADKLATILAASQKEADDYRTSIEGIVKIEFATKLDQIRKDESMTVPGIRGQL
jgi:hypothetical protein